MTRQRGRGRLVALILWIAFIWANSLMPGDASSAESGFLLQLLRPLIEVLGIDDLELAHTVLRKIGHFTEYAVLGVLAWRAFGREALVRAIAIGVAVPCIDETIQRFVPGREWTVPIVGEGTALPVVEIRPKVDWYDWRAKYSDDAGTDYVFPGDDPANAELAARTQEIALRAYRAVGARGMGRIDLRVAPDGGIFALENNSIPGLTSHSLLPKAAAKAGIPFPELCSRILEDARCG